jgi:hypothetical protein
MYCFDARGGEFPKMCGWLMKTIQMTCAKARFPEQASVSLPSDPNVEVNKFYILNLSFLRSLVDIYSFLGISCVFQCKKRKKKRKNKPRKRYVGVK